MSTTPVPSPTVTSKDWLFVALPGMIWGASFLFIAEGLNAVGPNGITFIRILVGCLTLSMFPAARKSISREAWPAIALLGVIWFAFPLTMFPYAEQRVSSALTGMLNAVTPLSTAVVAAVIARALPSRKILGGLAVGMFGTVLVALPSFGEGHSSAIGVLMILVAVLSYGFALNLARPLQQRHGALPVIVRAQAIAALLTAPLGMKEIAVAHWSPKPVLALLALGALGTGAAFAFIGMAAARVGATRASAAAFLIPPVALLLGVVVRGEHVAALSVVGSAICVAGAWMIRPQQTPAPAKETITPQLDRCVPARG
jgi:drug/metabolite transporter (DMT)-like permease